MRGFGSHISEVFGVSIGGDQWIHHTNISVIKNEPASQQ